MINTITEIEYKISQLQANYSNRSLKVGFFGAFSTGKSTLINAILSQENLLPTHAIETTAKLTVIKYGETDYVNIHKKDGTVQTCELAVLADFVLNTDNTEQISWLEVFLNDEKLQNVEITDTPGYNSLYESQKEQGLQALLDVDVAFYICRPEGITANDFAVLQMMSAQQPNINFVMNAIDVVPISEQEYAKNMLEQKITEFTNARSQVLLTSAKTGEGISELTTLIFETLGEFVDAYQTEKANIQIINYLEKQKKAIEVQREIIEKQLENPQLDQKLEMVNLKANLDTIETQIETQLKEQVGKLSEIIDQFKTKNQMEVRTTLSTVEQQFDTIYPNIETLSTVINKKIVDFSEQMQNEYLNTLATTFNGIITEINSSPSLQFVDLQLPNIEEVAVQYEHQKNQMLAEVELEKQDTHKQIESLEEDKDVVINSMSEFSMEMSQLETQKNEAYQPLFDDVEVLDSEAKKKVAMLKILGGVGDFAISAGLAFVSAGGSLALNGSKEMTKIATKEATKKAAQKAAARETTRAAAKQAAKKAAAKAAAKATAKATAKKAVTSTLLSTVSAVLNPCSTLLGGVANGIEITKVEQVENEEYKQQFFHQKLEITRHYDQKQEKLQQLEASMRDNDMLLAQAKQKLQNIEAEKRERLTEIEKDYQYNIDVRMKSQLKAQISEHAEQLLKMNANELTKWAEQSNRMLMTQVQENIDFTLLNEKEMLKEQIELAEASMQKNETELQEQLQEIQTHIASIQQLQNQYLA